jgi:serine/threonine-protein kinase
MSQSTVFNGRYELHRRIARGGMADVFLARDQLLDRPVAVKVLFPEYAADPSFVERFRREAQSAANLNHPNIVSVYDWGQEQGTYFIVMEYVEGRSLADIIKTEGPLHPQRAAEVASDMAAALGFAHRNGMVHRDVKPGNVLISPTGQVKVADFGIARALGASSDDNLTQAGSVMGTATYFSPEQAQGLPLDPRSDLYALGVVLYEMVTGGPPFTGDSPVAIAYKHVQEQAVLPRQVNPDVPVALEAIILKLMAKSPAARYASADDLRADLRRFSEGLPVAAMGGAANATQAMNATQAVAATQATTAIAPDDYIGPPEEKKRSGLFLVVLIILLALLGLLLFALAKVLTSDNGGTDTVDLVVPNDLQNRSQAEATQALNVAGFDVSSVNNVQNDAIAAGFVVATNPQGGTKVTVKKGERGSVVLIVSAGASSLPMPNVIGRQLDDAVSFLKSQGFTGTITPKLAPNDDSSVGLNEVFAQDPSPGDATPKDGAITLTASSGPTKVTIPDVSNTSAADAANQLGQAGFKTTTQNQPDNTVPEGQVISTNPPAGTQANKGSTVLILVSSGPAQVQVLSVVGLSRADAVNQLQQQGFVVTTQGNGDVVTNQDPAGGTMAPKGSQVKLTLAKSDSSSSSSS